MLTPNKQAIVANWMRADNLWLVDTTERPSVLGAHGNAFNDAAANSVVVGSTSTERLRSLADYLDLDFAWLARRCAELDHSGCRNLIQPRSRLLTSAGVDAALRYVGRHHNTTTIQKLNQGRACTCELPS